MQSSQTRKLESENRVVDLSVIVPTYNESENILQLLRSIIRNIPSSFVSEIIVVVDNYPGITGEIADFDSMEYRNQSLIESRIIPPEEDKP